MSYIEKDRGLGAIALAGTAFLWSLAGLLIKLVDWNPFAIACGRSVVAAVFLLAWIRKPKFTFSGPQVGAAVASSATMFLFIYANKATTAANAILLQYGSPIFTAILGAVFLKEKPKPEHWLAFLAVAGGMALFFMGDIGGGSMAGNLAAIAAGVTFAAYFVFMRMQKDSSPLESNLLAHILTATIGFAIALFMPAPVFSLKAVAAIGALGVFQIGLAAVLLSWAIKRVSAIQGSIIAGLEPVFNPLWVFLALGERPGANALAGGAVIICAVVASSVVTARRARR
ncbi:MAG: DMT family transporter [Spirochaetes bacterium]|nr:DMT family transporter [Spirochaetota bacterium]MBU1080960.1 DMT family transporter [Spirochaetota bacterium]